MNPKARKIWGSKQGQSLLRALLAGEELNPIQREASRALKDVDASPATDMLASFEVESPRRHSREIAAYGQRVFTKKTGK